MKGPRAAWEQAGNCQGGLPTCETAPAGGTSEPPRAGWGRLLAPGYREQACDFRHWGEINGLFQDLNRFKTSREMYASARTALVPPAVISLPRANGMRFLSVLLLPLLLLSRSLIFLLRVHSV